MKNVRLRRKNNLFIATFLRYDIFMKAQKGNALFLILIAVALFAALSYAVTNSGRGGSGIDKEQAEITAAQILQILSNTDAGLQRFMIIGGYDIDEIDMFSTGLTMTGDTNACTTDECNLFHTDGGGVLPPLLPTSAIASSTTCNYVNDGKIRPFFLLISVEGVGSDLADIAVFYCGVDINVCKAINNRMNIKEWNDTALTFSLGTSASSEYLPFSNAYTSPMSTTAANFLGTTQDSRINGTYTLCRETNKADGAGLLHVILPR